MKSRPRAKQGFGSFAAWCDTQAERVELDALPMHQPQRMCLRTLRRRVELATTGTGMHPLALAIAAAVVGVRPRLAAALFSVSTDAVRRGLANVSTT